MNSSRDSSESGASAVEYGLLVAGIAAVIVAVVFGIGVLTDGQFTDTSTCLEQGAAATC